MNPSPDIDPSNIDLQGKKGSKVPLIVVGVVVAGGIAFFVVNSMKQREARKAHAQFIEDFANLEKNDVGKFWSCVLGDKADPKTLTDNLVLGSKVTANFGTDPKNYPKKITEECTSKAVDASKKALALTGPPEYEPHIKAYSTALKQLADAFDAWSKVAPGMVRDIEINKKLNSSGPAWHSHPGGKPAPEVAAFDRFLHCAVPTVDTLKDGQALVEFLYNECKKPEAAQKIVETCGPELIADPPGAPTKNFAATQKKLGGDDRDLQGFDACVRKGRKGKRLDDLADVGKAFVALLEAGSKIRETGKEALKD